MNDHDRRATTTTKLAPQLGGVWAGRLPARPNRTTADGSTVVDRCNNGATAIMSTHHEPQAQFTAPRWRPASIVPTILLTLMITQNTSHGLQQRATTTSPTPGFRPPLQFGSTRYVYPRNSNHRQLLNSHYRYDVLAASENEHHQNGSQLEEEEGAAETILRDQLIELRKKLESRLAASSGRRQVTLGSACSSAKDCSSRINNSHCRLDNYTCSCLSNHVEYNSTVCLPSALLGFKCSIDSQCEQRVANSFCLADTNRSTNSGADKHGQGICSCKSHFIAHRRDKCLAGSQINEYCLSNEQCRLSDPHSYCHWKITNIYGTCKCPANYLQLQQPASEPSTRCVPRLGDVCLTEDECQLATPNSSCREPSRSEWNFRAAGRSQVANSTGGLRCLCEAGFVVSANKLHCFRPNDHPSKSPDATKIDKPPPGVLQGSNLTSSRPIITLADFDPHTTTSRLDMQKHHYDLVVTLAPSEVGAPATPGPKAAPTTAAATTTTTTTTTATPTTTTTTTTRPALVVSSLGKKCQFSAQCRARDPNSDCIGGICECLRPTSKCGANSTGCHGDTFQCRNGQCISWYFVCDQFKNCADGSDEDECQWAQCPPEAFQCSSGQCLARSRVCNGRRDCSDGSDELNCDANMTLQLSPANTGASQQQLPHAHPHRTAADWLSLGGSKPNPLPACNPKAFTCSNGQCLPAYVFCNAVQDCSDGSDELEQFCERKTNRNQQNGTTTASTTPPEQTTTSESLGLVWRPGDATGTGATNTSNGASALQDSPLVKADRLDINKMLASLNHRRQQQQQQLQQRLRQAPTASGQLGQEPTGWRRRSRLLTESARRRQRTRDHDEGPQEKCPGESFTCANGKCRSTAILCSGVDGCGDNSDESQCEVCQCEQP